MKVRESDMPKEDEWSRFFDPKNILLQLGLNRDINDVVDFGSGYGTFAIPVAQMIGGNVYALEIELEMVHVVEQKAKKLNLENVKPILRDFVSLGSGLMDSTVDFVTLFNILHLDKPIDLLREAYRVLVVGGKVGIIHWNYDPKTPRGPPMNIRPKPEQIRQWAESVGFIFEQQFNFKPYHYGFRFRK
jgi:ubiquinone/menaquinone biosynthesis C-methylase UbiE